MFIYIIPISKQKKNTSLHFFFSFKPTDGFLSLTGTLNHKIPKHCASITSVHLRLYQSDVTVTTNEVWCWGWSVAKVWSFRRQLKNEQLLRRSQQRKKWEGKTQKGRVLPRRPRTISLQNMHVINQTHTPASQGDQESFPPLLDAALITQCTSNMLFTCESIQQFLCGALCTRWRQSPEALNGEFVSVRG